MQNALDQAQAAFPTLGANLPPLGASQAAGAALRLLQAAQSHNVQPSLQQLPLGSDLPAATAAVSSAAAAAVAAAGWPAAAVPAPPPARPAAAPPPGGVKLVAAPPPQQLLSAAGIFGPTAGAESPRLPDRSPMPYRAAASAAAAPSAGYGGGQDWGPADAGTLSDGSVEHQRKRARRDDTGSGGGNGKVRRAASRRGGSRQPAYSTAGAAGTALAATLLSC